MHTIAAMPQNTAARAEVECWKQHTCVGCRAVYRYVLRRSVSGWGPGRWTAGRAARKAAFAARMNAVDMQPCPMCGLHQPDMISAQRTRAHTGILIGVAVCLGALVLANVLVQVLGLPSLLQYHVRAWGVATVCGLALAAHTVAEARNPNRSLGKNAQLGQQRLQAKEIELLNRGAGPQRPFLKNQFRRSLWPYLGLVALALLPVLALAPELLRLANGWPLNPEWRTPVAGPGDFAHMDFGESISSIRGTWKGAATAEVVNWQEVGLPEKELKARTAEGRWGDTMFVKSTDENKSTGLIWANVALPRGQDLQGTTLQIEVKLTATYPAVVTNGTYSEMTRDFQRSLELRPASPLAGNLYGGAWVIGSLGAGGLVLLLGYLFRHLAHRLRKQALPVTVIPLHEEDDPDVPEWIQGAQK